MGFKTPEGEDKVEAVAYTRDSSAQEALRTLNYLTDNEFSEEPPSSYPGDIYRTYKVTIVIEPA